MSTKQDQTNLSTTRCGPNTKSKQKNPSRNSYTHHAWIDGLMKGTDLIPEPKEFNIQLSKRECASLTIDPRAREKGSCMIQDQGQPPEKKTSHKPDGLKMWKDFTFFYSWKPRQRDPVLLLYFPSRMLWNTMLCATQKLSGRLAGSRWSFAKCFL